MYDKDRKLYKVCYKGDLPLKEKGMIHFPIDAIADLTSYGANSGAFSVLICYCYFDQSLGTLPTLDQIRDHTRLSIQKIERVETILELKGWLTKIESEPSVPVTKP